LIGRVFDFRHGARQVRNPWSDGPEYITQCPIKPGNMFKQIIHLTTEEGTIWWHAHNGWARATVHGAVIIYPKRGHTYPFPKPHAEVPIILGTTHSLVLTLINIIYMTFSICFIA
jgi:laccase